MCYEINLRRRRNSFQKNINRIHSFISVNIYAYKRCHSWAVFWHLLLSMIKGKHIRSLTAVISFIIFVFLLSNLFLNTYIPSKNVKVETKMNSCITIFRMYFNVYCTWKMKCHVSVYIRRFDFILRTKFETEIFWHNLITN